MPDRPLPEAGRFASSPCRASEIALECCDPQAADPEVVLDAATRTPDAALAPLFGLDGAGFRMGFGGGCFDRTLSALSQRPLTVDIDPPSARLATNFPQLHDIALNVILTEAGVQFHREGS
jgi:5-formyltetrahydrofolate cyclo-ligase